MQNKNLISIFFLFQNLVLFAQPSIEWQKCLGGSSEDQAYSIEQTFDGGFILAGWTASIDGDVWEELVVNLHRPFSRHQTADILFPEPHLQIMVM